MIDKKIVNDLLDSIIDIIDKLSWVKLDSVGMYKASFPNGEYLLIDNSDSVPKLCYGKWVISSADYPPIYDLVLIVNDYFKREEEKEVEPDFMELKSLVDNLRS